MLTSNHVTKKIAAALWRGVTVSRTTANVAALISVAALNVSHPLSAQDNKAGGWTIVPGDDYCSMVAHFDGPGNPGVFLSVFPRDDRHLLVITNENWGSLIDGKNYPIKVELEGGTQVWSGTAQGMSTDAGTKGLAMPVTGAAFLSDFSQATGMRVSRDSTFLLGVSLEGSSRGIVAAVDCAAVQLRQSNRDPFADDIPAADDLNRPPRPLNRSSWIRPDDYPSKAVKEGREGTTVASFRVGKDGLVSDCIVESSSGSPDLDAAACELIVRRARYSPAVDGRGNILPSADTQTIRWATPQRELAGAVASTPTERIAQTRRIWVQVATGRNPLALSGDWRSLERSSRGILSGLNPYLIEWGATNRLVAGPIEDHNAAKELIRRLKEQGIDAFAYVSEPGEAADFLRTN